MTKAIYDRMQIAAIEGLAATISFNAHKINMRAKALAVDSTASDSISRGRMELAEALAGIITDLGVMQSIINSQDGEL